MLLRAGLTPDFAAVVAANTLAQRDSSCNPLTATCPAIPGLATSEYYVDFTQQPDLPPNWIQANYETVDFGPNGAEFTFAKRYDAPYIWTNFYMLFGHIDVVMQAAPGVGIISSAVLLSDDLDEIDWEFSGNNFGSPSGKVQTNYYGKVITGNYDRGTQPAANTPETQFHTYTFDWSPQELTWSIDGVVVRTLLATNSDNDTHQYPQTPSRLHLGLWDAGDQDSNIYTVEWAGGYTNISLAPFTMYVRSVRISNSNPCSSYQYTDTSGSWQSIKCVNTTLSSAIPVSTTSSVQSDTTSTSFPYIEVSSSSLPTISITEPSIPSSTSTTFPVSSSITDTLQLTSTSASSAIPTSTPLPNYIASSPSTSLVSSFLTSNPPLSSYSGASTLSSSDNINFPAFSSILSIQTTAENAVPSGTVFGRPSSTTARSVLAAPAPSNVKHCNRDNCLNNLIDARYSKSASAFCSTYTTSLNTGKAEIPTYLAGCVENFSRVSSACSCVITSSPTLSPDFPSPANSSSSKLIGASGVHPPPNLTTSTSVASTLFRRRGRPHSWRSLFG